MLVDHLIRAFGAGANLAAGVAYVRVIRRGLARPDYATWAIWSAAGAIIVAEQLLQQGVLVTNVFAAVVAVVPWLVLIAACLQQPVRWRTTTELDLACLIVSVGALVLMIVGLGDIKIWAAVAAYTIGSLPALRNAFRSPDLSALVIHLGIVVGSGCAVLAVESPGLAVRAPTLCVLGFNSLLVLVILICPSSNRKVVQSPAGSDDHERAVVDAVGLFAMLFVRNWAANDPEKPERRRSSLRHYFSSAIDSDAVDALIGSPPYLQTVDTVGVGAVTRPGLGDFQVEVRLCVTSYGRVQAGTWRGNNESSLPGIPMNGPDPLPRPGWQAEIPRSRRMIVHVVTCNGQMSIGANGVTPVDLIRIIEPP